MRRVVITGIGMKTPVGNTKQEFWKNICDGKHGIRPIEIFDTSDIDVKVAAVNSEFDYEECMDKKEARRTDRFCQLALAAAQDALKDCGSDLKNLYDPYRIGVIVSSGIGGLPYMEQEHKKFLEKGAKRVSVFFIPAMISNMAAGMIAIRTGFKGANFCPVTACASSNHALGEAFHKIRHGYLDACIAGGAEASITKFAAAGFNNMTALSKSSDPDRASIPFDKERNGFVMGEGAGILVLEEFERAKERGAHIYAEIAGYGATDDAYHITAPDPDGEAGEKCLEMAIQDAGLKPEQIEYINAHGTSTPPNDKGETKSIRNVFGEHADKLMVSSTKSMTGHMLGAAGAVESIITSLALQDGIVPPTAGYRVPDEECGLDYVPIVSRKVNIKAALSNSLGFGGHNATICLKKYEA